MEKALQNRLLYFFVALFIITNLGFYKTYLVHFPTFEGFAAVYHIHGMLAMAWILMLIAQAYLIRANKYELHKLIGKLSYIVFPLFLASLFFVAKEAYFRNIKKMPQADALAQMPLGGTIDIFFLGLAFAFAMVYKKNVGFHMRFMASTGLAILGPGLGRFLFAFLNLPGPVGGIIMLICTIIVPIVWLIMDIKNKKSAFPMGFYVFVAFCMNAAGIGSHSAIWQGFAKWWVETLY
ncbi:hypothetical protein FHS57_000953 [Runella defluvii]|uniref:DUF2306 domain-containing protein n=1 Tax=Runella defluvii TaxID=370973 RepID=A0A7W6EP44_9BACT|nr:hypothetical protein [Runella defluvii]MBB3836971.1 hypothetical protein [Runella defluvii]